MKKVILFLVLTVVVSGSLFAQKKADKKLQKRTDAYIALVESKTTLTKVEKEKLIVLKTEQLQASSLIAKEHKGTPEFKVKRKELNKEFSASLTKAFGKERAKEIEKASKKDKKKKKKK